MKTSLRLIQAFAYLLTNTDIRMGVDSGRAEQAAADLWTNMHFTIADQSTKALQARAREARKSRSQTLRTETKS